MARVFIKRTLFSPNGREKMELSGPRSGKYEFRVWHLIGKSWRREFEQGDFESCSRAVVVAARKVDWLGQVLTPPDEPLLSYHLELLRGLTFRFAGYPNVEDHDHCRACWAKISDFDSPEVQHEGYLTKYVIPNGAGETQDDWICTDCFPKLRNQMQWQLPEAQSRSLKTTPPVPRLVEHSDILAPDPSFLCRSFA